MTTMHQKVDEPVDVLASFVNNQLQPLFFKWDDRRYKVHKVNLVHQSKNGSELVWHYAISSEANSFVLAYNSHKMQWKLEEVFVI